MFFLSYKTWSGSEDLQSSGSSDHKQWADVSSVYTEDAPTAQV